MANGVASLDPTGNVPASQLGNAPSAVTTTQIPFNVQAGAYTTTSTDAGLCIFHPPTDNAQRRWTIAASTSVVYLIGTAITFINQASTVTIAMPIPGDLLFMAGTTTTGARLMSTVSVATAVKMTSNSWVINGIGLS